MVTRLARNLESFAGNFGILERPIGRRGGKRARNGERAGQNRDRLRFFDRHWCCEWRCGKPAPLRFRDFDDDDLPEGYGQVQIDKRTMGADSDGICAYRDMHVIGPPRDDPDGIRGRTRWLRRRLDTGARFDERKGIKAAWW
jgi:hypothetical protein